VLAIHQSHCVSLDMGFVKKATVAVEEGNDNTMADAQRTTELHWTREIRQAISEVEDEAGRHDLSPLHDEDGRNRSRKTSHDNDWHKCRNGLQLGVFPFLSVGYLGATL